MESMGFRPTVLVLEDEPQTAARFAQYSRVAGADSVVASSLAEFTKILARGFLPDVGLIDLSLDLQNEKDRQGLDAIRTLSCNAECCITCVLSSTITRLEMSRILHNDWTHGDKMRVNDIILKIESPRSAKLRVRTLVEQVESRRREHFSNVLRFVVPRNVDVVRFENEIEQFLGNLNTPGDVRRIFRVAFGDFLPVSYPREYGRMRTDGRMGVVLFRVWSYRVGRPIIVFVGAEDGVRRVEQRGGDPVFDVRALKVMVHRPGIRVFDARARTGTSTHNANK